ncbi:MAG: end-binding protein Ku [Bacillota bacterium]|nr:end-binding protein Ku [Bacillota bacterium]MDK2882147.1 end-binding protein Ku [Bacillota bacterium]
MRSLWRGSVSFGLVNIPVRLYAATEKQDIKFRYLHKECLTPIEYEKRCPTCRREVAADEIVWGYEYEKGRFVVLDEEDFDRLPLHTTKTIDILDFVALQEVDPAFFQRTYFLEPAEGGAKAYQLLRQAMEKTGRIAIAKVTLRAKESLAAVRTREGALVLTTMFYANELRSPQGLNLGAETVEVSDKELELAVRLVEELTTKFTPEKYTSEYRAALSELIQAKIAGAEIKEVGPAPRAEVVDLMEALRASLSEARKEREPKAKKARAKKAV